MGAGCDNSRVTLSTRAQQPTHGPSTLHAATGFSCWSTRCCWSTLARTTGRSTASLRATSRSRTTLRWSWPTRKRGTYRLTGRAGHAIIPYDLFLDFFLSNLSFCSSYLVYNDLIERQESRHTENAIFPEPNLLSLCEEVD